MSWQSDWLAGFALFSRPIKIKRGNGAYLTVAGFARALKTDEVVGDFDSTSMMVIIPVTQLALVGLNLPQVYDRVDTGDGVDRVVQSFKIEYAQNAPMWAKLVVAG